jgi:hypothetical protein
MYIKDKELKVLELLAQFKYLKSSQFVRLNLYKNRGDVTKCLKKICKCKKPLIMKTCYPIDKEKGKLEDFYHLSSYGKKLLLENYEYMDNIIKIPSKNNIESPKDYNHKSYNINLHISLKLWLDKEGGYIDFLDYYFDKLSFSLNHSRKKYFKSINSIELNNGTSFIPDINMKFTINKKTYLFLFEQHNGKSIQRIVDQLLVHALAITDGVVHKKYNFDKSHRVLIVCEFDEIKDSIINRLHNDKRFVKLYNYFLFKSNDELLNTSFNENWTLMNKKVINLHKISLNNDI